MITRLNNRKCASDSTNVAVDGARGKTSCKFGLRLVILVYYVTWHRYTSTGLRLSATNCKFLLKIAAENV